MNFKLICAAVIFATCSAANAQVTTGDVFGAQQFGSWNSMGIRFGDSDIRYRAVTTGSAATMALDLSPPDCAVTIQFIFPFSKPSETDIPSTDIDVAWRIDDGQLANLKGFTGAVAMGDSNYIVYMYAFKSFEAVHTVLQNGAVLRIRETIASVPYYSQFQLNGFESALQRARNACLAALPSAPAPQRQKKKNPTPSSSGEAKIL